MTDSSESTDAIVATVETLETSKEILLGRNLDRILGYVKLKMDVALAANAELSSTRTQIVQMGTFLLVAFVVGTGGVQSLIGWNLTALAVAGGSAVVVALVVLGVTRTSARYTDIVMDEFHALETLYALIVWEKVDNIEDLTDEIRMIEQSTRAKIDAENKKHRLLTGTILHSMIHYERHSPYSDDIGDSRHHLHLTDADGHRPN
uniref:SMODS and SLOG-associating 2TM effector domain-containing protein n=1 Tax=uncultured marine group II/III euryarchaeote KM3_85_D06 TaxID=1456528 RepID=A0A075HU54_9EURY|nr:hypothetical protein [uncultured marine group II/III euryarchaeote KM3_85_D06]